MTYIAPERASLLRLCEEAGDLEVFPTGAVRFIPMDLSVEYPTILQADPRDTLQLSPSPTAVFLP